MPFTPSVVVNEEEILGKDMTGILVSHDRRLVAAVANRFFAIERGKLREIEGPEPFYDSLLAA